MIGTAMTQKNALEYRVYDLPGFGRVKAPAHITEAELLAAIQDSIDKEPDAPNQKPSASGA